MNHIKSYFLFIPEVHNFKLGHIRFSALHCQFIIHQNYPPPPPVDTKLCDILMTVLLDKINKQNSQNGESQHYQNSYRLECPPNENVSNVFMETLNI
jgi:hypothetical protein